MPKIVTVEPDSSLGGIPIKAACTFDEALTLFRASPVATKLPRGEYLVVRHGEGIALLEHLRFGVVYQTRVLWICETIKLRLRASMYSSSLPIIVGDQSLHRLTIHHNAPQYNAKLWHYMKKWKFKAMLEEGGISLTRADLFSDHREGTLSCANLLYRQSVYRDHPIMAGAHNFLVQELRKMRRHTFVSCGRMDDEENLRSWEEYADGQGVAVQTTYGKIGRHTQSIFCARVEYGDYESSWIPEGNSMFPFMYKEEAQWAWEREFRVICQRFPKSQPMFGSSSFYDCSQTNPDYGNAPGLILEVDLRELIDCIVIGPETLESEERQLIDLAQEHGMQERVRKSVFCDSDKNAA